MTGAALHRIVQAWHGEKERMTARTVHVYLRAETEAQLVELQERWGVSRSAAIAMAIEQATEGQGS